MEIKTQETLNNLRPLLHNLEKATQTLLASKKLASSDKLSIRMSQEKNRENWFHLQVYSEWKPMYADRPERRPASSWAMNWLGSIPESSPKTDRSQAIASATDTTALMIFATWDYSRISFEDELSEKLYEYLITKFLMQTQSSIKSAKYKLTKEVPDMPDGWVDHPERPLAPYQKTGVALGWHNPSFAFFMQQGTGKTPTAVNLATNEARVKDGPYRCLVVCPGQVRTNWMNEFERFTVTSGKVSVLRGSPIGRVKNLVDLLRPEEDCDFHTAIISYDSVASTLEALTQVPWDRIILDESHYIKSGGSQRTKAVRKLTECAKHRLILTGTPIPNNVFELFSQMEFLGEGESGFLLRERFRKFYGKWKRAQGGRFEQLEALKNLPLIQERLTRLSFIVKKAEAGLNLPEKRYNILEVEMSSKQSEIYQQMKNELIVEITNYVEEAKSQGKDFLVADHILTQMLRLSQITSGFLKTTERADIGGETVVTGTNTAQIDTPNAKAKVIIDDMREAFLDDPNCKKIIWCHFIEDIRVVCEALQQEGISFCSYHPQCPKEFRIKGTEESVRKFNEDPTIKVFVGSPNSAAEGMNIIGYDYWNETPSHDCYTDQEYFFSTDWSAVKRAQAEDRAHRRGTRANSVIITDVVVPGTIDEEIRARVTEKRIQAENIQSVKDVLKNVLDLDI